MNPILNGSKVPNPTSHKLLPIPNEINGFKNIKSLNSGFKLFCKDFEEKHWLDHEYKVILSDEIKKTSQSETVDFVIKSSDISPKKINGFRKITHIIDPIQHLQEKYIQHPDKLEKKKNDPMNQAYIESIASYIVGKLKDQDISPHFHSFYGAFSSVADSYKYNISDSYMSFRNKKWFWNALNKNMFSFEFDDDTDIDVKNTINEIPNDLVSLTDSDSSSSSSSSSNSENILTHISLKSIENIELKSTDGDDISEEENYDTSTNNDSDSCNSDINIYTNITNFPVMMIYTDFSSGGTLDDLLEKYDIVTAEPGTERWNTIWAAWIFQIISSLCVLQSLFGFTHNDLHSNNIVWEKTDEKFIYYTNRQNTIWRIPTFGKIMKVIDFGRAVFTVNGQLFFSDDFREGNDAAEQYNFGELKGGLYETVYPNPSFDLSRLSISIIESLFPIMPELKKKGKVLSIDSNIKKMETVCPLYNMLWCWIVDTNGNNILVDEDGDEKYPDFTLYKVLASSMKSAIPLEQINNTAFNCFKIKKDDIPKGVKIYSLFC